MQGNGTHYGYRAQHRIPAFKKLRPKSVTSRIQPGTDIIVCAEMDEQWSFIAANSRPRWLFYAYDRLRKKVVAHVFGEKTRETLERLLSLLSAFEVVMWMTVGWQLYEARLKGNLHIISKRYTQRIERPETESGKAGEEVSILLKIGRTTRQGYRALYDYKTL